ncbi:MAG: hypothetical protein LH660_19325 [Phormidesmis sp. CAN_BIN36]|nr:hypothetical protein [Phormidesmis sp. CAN_BIN36]
MSFLPTANRSIVVAFLLAVGFTSSLVDAAPAAVVLLAPTQPDASKLPEVAKTQQEAQKFYRQGEDKAKSDQN